MGDPEIEAMGSVATALAGLEDDARGRVLHWAAERFGVTIAGGRRRQAGTGTGTGDQEGGNADDSVTEKIAAGAPVFEHFAELFATAGPKTVEDKALVAAYWVQVIEGQDQWPSRRLNAELKHLGHSIPNITQALTSNINKRPQRVIQLKKSGSTKQATKTYKITSEGLLYLQGMLSGGDG